MNSLFLKLYFRKSFRFLLIPFSLIFCIFFIKDIILSSFYPVLFMKLFYKYSSVGFFWYTPFENSSFENMISIFSNFYYIFLIIHSYIICSISAQEKKLNIDLYFRTFQKNTTFETSRCISLIFISLINASIFSFFSLLIYSQLEIKDWNTILNFILYSIFPAVFILTGLSSFMYKKTGSVLFSFISILFVLQLNQSIEFFQFDVSGSCLLMNNSFRYFFESGTKYSSFMLIYRVLLSIFGVLLIFYDYSKSSSFYLYSFSFLSCIVLYKLGYDELISQNLFYSANLLLAVSILISGIIFHKKHNNLKNLSIFICFFCCLFSLTFNSISKLQFKYLYSKASGSKNKIIDTFNIKKLYIKSRINNFNISMVFKNIPKKLKINPYWNNIKFINCKSVILNDGSIVLQSVNFNEFSRLEYMVDFSELSSFSGKNYYFISEKEFIFPFINARFICIDDFHFEPISLDFTNFIEEKAIKGKVNFEKIVFMKNISMTGGIYTKIYSKNLQNVFYFKPFTSHKRQMEFVEQVNDIQSYISKESNFLITGIESSCIGYQYGSFFFAKRNLFYKKYKCFTASDIKSIIPIILGYYYKDKTCISFGEHNLFNYFFSALVRNRNSVSFSNKFKRNYFDYFSGNYDKISTNESKDQDIFSVPWLILIKEFGENTVFSIIKKIFKEYRSSTISISHADQIIFNETGWKNFLSFFTTNHVKIETKLDKTSILISTNIPFPISINTVLLGNSVEYRKIILNKQIRIDMKKNKKILIDVDNLLPVNFKNEFIL